MALKPVNHGRDHRPGGSDPIPRSLAVTSGWYDGALPAQTVAAAGNARVAFTTTDTYDHPGAFTWSTATLTNDTLNLNLTGVYLLQTFGYCNGASGQYEMIIRHSSFDLGTDEGGAWEGNSPQDSTQWISAEKRFDFRIAVAENSTGIAYLQIVNHGGTSATLIQATMRAVYLGDAA